MLSHTSVGFLVEICLSRSLLQWDMEKCRRYTKSQDTQCKAPTGHSGGHSVAQDVTRNLWTQHRQISKHGQFWARQFPL